MTRAGARRALARWRHGAPSAVQPAADPPMVAPVRIDPRVAGPGVNVDGLHVDPIGVVRVTGWSCPGPVPPIAVSYGGHRLEARVVARVHRPDVASANRWTDEFVGFVVDFHCGTDRPDGGRLALHVAGAGSWEGDVVWPVLEPHYDGLLNENRILDRAAIYGTGPPSVVIAGDNLALARSLAEGRVLDFGCGAAPLVRALRTAGVDAFGLEVDRDDLVLDDDVARYVTRYDGVFPSPFSDRSFDVAFCFEVLEHLADPESAVAELARLTRSACAVTVPDASAIPFCFRHGVVPWHLLEASHVNFFTPASLLSVMQRHFARVDLVRVGPVRVNDVIYHQSVGAIARH